MLFHSLKAIAQEQQLILSRFLVLPEFDQLLGQRIFIRFEILNFFPKAMMRYLLGWFITIVILRQCFLLVCNVWMFSSAYIFQQLLLTPNKIFIGKFPAIRINFPKTLLDISVTN
ncbi:hypothetical protein V8G54_003906 [Vigna mungo]|uniref:Uncharacterized protein n=1 Tax=Vigna mungo TaxID=3915 RepID=A0AAQ3PCV1_VIGMU